jgi:hypothetical protein
MGLQASENSKVPINEGEREEEVAISKAVPAKHASEVVE